MRSFLQQCIKLKLWAIAALLVFVMLPATAVAAPPVPDTEACDYSKYSAFTNPAAYYVANCIQARSVALGKAMIGGIQQAMQDVLVPLTSLAILLFAIRFMVVGATGEYRSTKDFAVLLFKISLIFACAYGNGEVLVDYMQTFMNSSAEMVMMVFDNGVTNLPLLEGADLCAINGGNSSFPNPNDATPPVPLGLPEVMYRFDCLFVRITGVENVFTLSGAHTKGIGLMIVGLFFTGPLGAAITIAALAFILLFFAAMGQVMLYLITVFLSYAILFGIAPIILPAMLFTVTKKMADVWFANVIAYLILPAVLMTFFMIMNIVMFAASSEFYNPSRAGKGGIYQLVSQANGEFDIFKKLFELPPNLFSSNSVAMETITALQDKISKHVDYLKSKGDGFGLNDIFNCAGKTVADCAIDNFQFIVDATGAIVAGTVNDATNIIEDSAKALDYMVETSKAFLGSQLLSGIFNIEIVKVGMEVILRFLALIVANIVMMSIMLGYSGRLIKDVQYMIGKSAVVAPNIAPSQRATDMANSAVRGAASLSSYGRYVE